MPAPTSDKIIIGISALVFAGGCAWAFMQQSAVTGIDQPVNPPVSGAPYEPVELTASIVAANDWPQPEPNVRGPLWLYHVFTPPVIYYNPTTAEFTVEPPERPDTTPPRPPEPFGVQLLAVTQEQFRLQLVGYSGDGDEARGIFLNISTNETLFARSGRSIPELDVEVVNVSIERKRTVVDGQPIIETTATAEVKDLLTGETHQLVNGQRLFTGDPVATLHIVASGLERTVRSGDTFEEAGATFTVESTAIDPPTVRITKKPSDESAPQTEVLTPRPPESTQDNPEGMPELETEEMSLPFFPGFQ